MKKAIIIGVIVGLFFSIMGIIGIYWCQWNPAHYVNNGLLCKDLGYVFYLPIIFQSSLIQPGNIYFNKYGIHSGGDLSFVIMIVITIIEFILLSLIISWILRKIRNRKI